MFGDEGQDPQKVDDKVVNLSELKEDKPYFMTLLHQHNRYMKAKENPEEMIRDNEKNFIEGPTMSVDGSFKHLS